MLLDDASALAWNLVEHLELVEIRKGSRSRNGHQNKHLQDKQLQPQIKATPKTGRELATFMGVRLEQRTFLGREEGIHK